MAKDYSGIIKKDRSHEIVGNFCYLGDTARAIKLDVDCLLTSVRSRFSKCRGLLFLITNCEIHLEAKNVFCFARL